MRLPEDALLIALAHGLEGLMLGTTTDAIEIATFVESTGVREIPSTPEAIEALLGDMEDAGLVRRLQLLPLDEPMFAEFPSISLTEHGWVRARELQEEEEQRPPPGEAT